MSQASTPGGWGGGCVRQLLSRTYPADPDLFPAPHPPGALGAGGGPAPVGATPRAPATPAGGAPAAGEVSEAGLAAASWVIYRIRQRFRYSYDGPAWDLSHRLVALPPARHGDQRAARGELVVSAPGARTDWRRGPDGARIANVTLGQVPPVLDFDVDAVVARGPASRWPALPASALTGRRLLAPTGLTAPDSHLSAVARRLASADPFATASRCCAWVHENIAYRPGTTSVATTAAEAAAGGAGVCQDQAHVMIALCRAAGLPARYVLGHMVGDGESHAWVEVLVPDGWAPPPPGPPPTATSDHGWAAALAAWAPDLPQPGPTGATSAQPGGAGAVAVAFDPCHDRLADRRYVTIAVGRDYRDVMPTSGVYTGSGRGVLTTSQLVEVVALGPAGPDVGEAAGRGVPAGQARAAVPDAAA
ncbi:MAG: transglutaminase family protein [Frankia sp.]|nr:transglutaminase family protein [Frankia sp.]